MKASYNIKIVPADNGVIVEVGCKTLVFAYGDYDRFFTLLRRYLSGDEVNIRKELGLGDGPPVCYTEDVPDSNLSERQMPRETGGIERS